MPTYHYQCKQEECGYDYKICHSIKNDILKKCPKCNNLTLETVFYPAYGFVRDEPKTVGMLAEQNNKKLGSQGMQEMWAKAEENKEKAKAVAREELALKLPEGASIPIPQKETPFYRPETSGPDMKLANLTPSQTEKFIKEGNI